jgi:transcriptional regulator with XRE-family HTH domain
MEQGWALAGLIKRRHDEGWSYRKIEKLAGGGLSHSQVQKWATDPKKHAPTEPQLIALAEGLQMPLEQIYDAVRKDWATPPTLHRAEDDRGDTIIASMYKELPEEAKRIAMGVVDQLYRQMKEGDRRRANG